MGSRILVGSGIPDHRSADETDAREPIELRRLTAVNRELGPGLAVYVLAESVGVDAGRVPRARRIPILCRVTIYDPGFYSQALLGPYHISWGT
jgi:hypothetical protein